MSSFVSEDEEMSADLVKHDPEHLRSAVVSHFSQVLYDSPTWYNVRVFPQPMMTIPTSTQQPLY
jgi:hypothetical protein